MPFFLIRLAEKVLKIKLMKPVFYFFLLFSFSSCLCLSAWCLLLYFPPPKPLLPLFTLIKFSLRFRSLTRLEERK